MVGMVCLPAVRNAVWLEGQEDLEVRLEPVSESVPLLCQGVRLYPTAGVGNLFSARGQLDIYNIIQGPPKMINLKIRLL